jgi:hypothetical protein
MSFGRLPQQCEDDLNSTLMNVVVLAIPSSSARNSSKPGFLPRRLFRIGISFLLLGCILLSVDAAPAVLDTNLQLRLVMFTTNSSGIPSTRISKDPRNNQLYYLKANGDIYQLNLAPGTASTSTLLYTAADHGVSSSVLGMTIGPDGTIYIVANIDTNSGNSTFAQVMKAVPNNTGGRTWSILARTEPYPKSRSAFDHLMSGMTVSPDGQFLFLNSGSRTDHGEVESTGGLYPGLRETGFTAKVLRLPANGSNLVLTNDIDWLRGAGYVFCEGTRNAFSLGFSPEGLLFGTDNGPDRDMSDELNWLRPGLHFGFPWRMGGSANPQQFASYNPSNDLLLDSRFVAVAGGTYHNDPAFPAPPTNFFEPVINLGPDADSYRDPSDGSIKDASALGQTLSTFTAHRSPLGLVFDLSGSMAPPYQKHGFMLSWTQGDPVDDGIAGPFKDPSQDMVDLDLMPLGGTNFQARVTRIVGGFSNPIDAAIITNRVYVIEYGGNQGIWEITFPPAPRTFSLNQVTFAPTGSFGFSFDTTSGHAYRIEVSTNLQSWSSIASLVASNSTFRYVDSVATNLARFYRVASP